MSVFEETEFGSRTIVGAAPRSAGPEDGERRRKAQQGGSQRPGKRSKKKGKKGKGTLKPKPKAKGRKARKSASSAPVSESGVLVPLDQWTRVLNQLGNLHEAGQQVADARERAARAETETAFLRERLKEMRAELEVLKRTDAGGR